MRSLRFPLLAASVVACSVACGGGDDEGGPGGSSGSSPGPTPPGATTPPTSPEDGPPAGNRDGGADIPAEAREEDVSNPRTVVGAGTPESCTGASFVDAVAKGGVITFDCGPAPATIVLSTTAKIFNDKGPIVIDGGGKITLSGGGKVRILYMNACDEAQVWTSGRCNDQTNPELTVQNLTFVDGNAKGLETGDNDGGGGAIYARGGRLKVVNARFFNNVCDDRGSDVGGGAIRKLDHLNDGAGDVARKVWIVNSTFGGAAGFGNTCANGGALSSIGVSWTILNSVLSHNKAIGEGANDGEGGNGGAIYNDGALMRLEIRSTVIEDNMANEGGSGIFFVSNDRTGSVLIQDSTLRRNPRGQFESEGFPGIFYIASAPPENVDSTIER